MGMVKWLNVKLGTVVSFKTGKLDSNAATLDGAYPFFTCSRETFRTDTYSFDTEAVLLAGNNAAGVFPIKYFKGKFDAYQRTYVIKTLDDTRLINRYLYYAFHPKLELMKNISTGVTTKFLTLTILNGLDLDLPPLPTQRKIAGILSAYDDLIDNNLRRIEVLEKMAQAIYREWFVDFRFPGHQKVIKMVDSELGHIPQGWDVKTMSEVAEVVDCSHARKPERIEDGNRILLHVWNVAQNGKLDLSETYLISDEDYAAWSKRIEVKHGDCIITKTGRVGAVAQIPKGVSAALGRNLVAIRWLDAPTFLLEYLLSPHKEKEVTILTARGTIMESLHVKAIEKLRIIVPPTPLLQKFEESVGPIRQQIENINVRNANLRRTRDLLLPRLISGKLDVSELDIDLGKPV